MTTNTRYTILIASTSRPNNDQLALALADTDHDLLHATNTDAAFKLIKDQHPDLVILDHKFDASFEEFYAPFAEQNPDIPLLVISPQAVTNAAPNPLLSFLTTPYTGSQLLIETTTLIVSALTERKPRKALAKTEPHYLDILENAQDVIYTHDLEGHYTFLNRRGRELTGYTADEITTIDNAAVTSPEHLALSKRMLRLKLERGTSEPTVYEIDLLTKDGRKIPVEISSQLMFTNGEPFAVLGIARDISARRQNEEAMALLNETLRDANVRADQQIHQLSNQISTLAQTLAAARELPAIFRTLVDFIRHSLPSDTIVLARYDQERNAALPQFLWTEEHGETQFDTPVPMELLNGSPGLAVVSKEVIIANNLTDQTIQERNATLNPHQHSHNQILSIMTIPMCMQERVLGLLEIQTSEPGAYTNEQKAPIATAANLAANAIENIRLIDRDRERERQLHQAQQIESVGRLAAHVAHDYNNLLTAMSGTVGLAKRKLQPGHAVRHDLTQIDDLIQRASLTSRQILSVGRKQILLPKNHNLNNLIQDKVKTLLQHIVGDDIQIITAFDYSIPLAHIDENQLGQILMNLAVNSRDAMPAGGTITINTRKINPGHPKHSRKTQAPEILMSFSDNGTGIDPSLHKQIFEPLFTTKPVGKGTGLGLSMVQGNIEQAGGSITVKSQLGKGTTFFLQLPAAHDPAAAINDHPEHTAENLPQEPEESATILIAEDSNVVRQTIIATLKSTGYSIIDAGDGQEAFELFKETPNLIHLIITDLLMPRMTGKDLAAKAKELAPNVKVLFMSGFTNEDLSDEGILTEGCNFLAKPFSDIQLLEAVRQTLNHPYHSNSQTIQTYNYDESPAH